MSTRTARVRHSMLQRVVGRPRFVDLGHVLLGPLLEVAKRFEQGVTERRELVVRAHGDRRRDGAGQQTVAFEVAQGLGEHLLTDTRDPVGQFAVAE